MILATCCLALMATGVSTGLAADDERPRHAAALDYVADIEVVPGADGEQRDTVTGVVFNDRNRDGRRQRLREPGIAGVQVSNGREVVLTDRRGRYELPAYDDMTVFVTKPNDHIVPVDADLVPQMAYEHKPAGSPPLRFGGLPPTGPLPEAINFPMVPTDVSDEFSCAVMGDTQAYSNTEVGYVRDSIATDLLAQDLSDAECMLLLGDVMGDDLGLLPRFKQMMSTVGLPQYYVHGNHDFDFDATSDDDSADTWRREYGPAYYSFDIGQVHFVVLDNVVYPCTEVDAAIGGRDFCLDPINEPGYNGRVTDRQMEWLANDLADVPNDKLVVVSHHIPLVSFVDNQATRHQTDNATELYALLEGRRALSLSGHTHTLENLTPGESYAGWSEAVGVEEIPFQHIVAGAPSGNWYSGDLDVDGVPMAISRLGEPRGYFTLDFDGNEYRDTFYASGQPQERSMWLSFSTPQFRDWFTTLRAWTAENPPTTQEIPPVNVNDLADRKLFTPEDLAEGVFLTANVWNGTRDSQVLVSIAGGEPLALTRTQPGEGEDVLTGVDYADPFAVVRQMQIARYAFQSTSGDERAQGYEQFRGSRSGPAPPQSVSQGSIAEKSSHLWRVQLPADLPIGAHVAEVSWVDRYGRTVTDQIVFEVLEERPPAFWRTEPWEDDEG